ncbi:uncharacterized protein HKW66_Vig0220600 [Vigna angularis]|uniref:Uncharacterized protein n=1 Tax=Phaseolus angularis TaxID=3914 RepID=A0A8T0K0C2_PHAAN|nr:uncharacterized protein HKW66_Vig0220600 [Vigna angularis]
MMHITYYPLARPYGMLDSSIGRKFAVVQEIGKIDSCTDKEEEKQWFRVLVVIEKCTVTKLLIR